jgi:hypothetical protein
VIRIKLVNQIFMFGQNPKRQSLLAAGEKSQFAGKRIGGIVPGIFAG